MIALDKNSMHNGDFEIFPSEEQKKELNTIKELDPYIDWDVFEKELLLAHFWNHNDSLFETYGMIKFAELALFRAENGWNINYSEDSETHVMSVEW
jgi:hypothetical protein